MAKATQTVKQQGEQTPENKATPTSQGNPNMQQVTGTELESDDPADTLTTSYIAPMCKARVGNPSGVTMPSPATTPYNH